MTLAVDVVGLNIQRRFVVTGFEARQVPRNVRTLASDRAARRRPAVFDRIAARRNCLGDELHFWTTGLGARAHSRSA